jgi:uncharacterized protein YjeT (DUF2065 family)
MRALLALLSILLRLAGLTLVVIGLWFSAGGLRVVVSGRIDERNSAQHSLKLGLPLLGAGLVVLWFGFWLEGHI